MLNIAKRQILPACIQYSSELASAVNGLAEAGITAGGAETRAGKDQQLDRRPQCRH